MTHGPIGSPGRKHEDHHGNEAIIVGGLEIYLGGTMYLTRDDLTRFDLLIPLVELNRPAGQRTMLRAADVKLKKALGDDEYCMMPLPMKDFGGVPDNWRDLLEGSVIPALRECNAAGKKVLAFCAGSHGRTGTLLASLIALLEPAIDDPIARARELHCAHCVETKKQALGIFALKGKELPVPEGWR